MKKILLAFLCISLMVAAGCGSTTDNEAESPATRAVDSSVGNSGAANNIYRDSGNITNATVSGGGTANPAASDSTSQNNPK